MARPSAYKWEKPKINGFGWHLSGFRGKKLAHLWQGKDGLYRAFVFLKLWDKVETEARGPWTREEDAMNALVDEMIPRVEDKK